MKKIWIIFLLALEGCISDPLSKKTTIVSASEALTACIQSNTAKPTETKSAFAQAFIIAWQECAAPHSMFNSEMINSQSDLLSTTGYSDHLGTQLQFLLNAGEDPRLQPGQIWGKDAYLYVFTPQATPLKTLDIRLVLTVRTREKEELGKIVVNIPLKDVAPGLQRLRWSFPLPANLPWSEGLLDFAIEAKNQQSQENWTAHAQLVPAVKPAEIVEPALSPVLPPLVRLREADNDSMTPTPMYQSRQLVSLIDVVKRVTARTSPNNQAKAVGVIPKGDRLPILATQKVVGTGRSSQLWYQVQFANNKKGWIPQGVTKIPPVFKASGTTP